MKTISSIITLRHFEEDEPLIIYSPDTVSNLSMQMLNEIAEIKAYVYDNESLYNLDLEIAHRSNSYVIDRKPSEYRKLYVRAKDIVMIQEAFIGLDDH